MRSEIDILASAIHDAKNQLFFAETACAEIAEREGIDLTAVRGSIERASNRLLRALGFYRLMHEGVTLAIIPVAVADLLEDGLALCGAQLRQAGIAAELDCQVNQVWPLDRDLVVDMLTNAMQNAARHAKSRLRVTADLADELLRIRVEDDGPGFETLDEAPLRAKGIGLYVGRQIARKHCRGGQCGDVRLENGGSLGGAVFELTLP